MSGMVERVRVAHNNVCLVWTSAGDCLAEYRIIDRNLPHDGESPLGGTIVHRHPADIRIFQECGLDKAPFGLGMILERFKARAAIAAMREPTDEITKDGMIRLAVLRNGTQATREEAATVWRAMVDAALK